MSDAARRADVLFNVMGFLDDEELLEAIHGPRVFVDIDPGFPHMWQTLGFCDLFEGHNAFVTIGLAVGQPSSTVPSCGRRWIPTPPPIALDAWPSRGRSDPSEILRATEVATWRGPDGPIDYQGITYGLRAHEFRAYADLPRRVPQVAFEIALDIDAADSADRSSLLDGGWCLRNPARLAATVDDYRSYIACSDLELSVAKQMYVRSRGGWFSDRSACYLASGRPVIAQDTGFAEHLPVGHGLLPFSDPDGATAAVHAVAGDIAGHSEAARVIAEEHFDARKVLPRVLTLAGVG